MSAAAPILPDPEATMEVAVGNVVRLLELPADQRPCLIDCREQEELGICRIDGCEWVPLGEFPQSVDRLKAMAERGVVVYCHHGMRSMHAVAFLRTRVGVENSFSMAGGIDLWAREVDQGMARY